MVDEGRLVAELTVSKATRVARRSVMAGRVGSAGMKRRGMGGHGGGLTEKGRSVAPGGTALSAYGRAGRTLQGQCQPRDGRTLPFMPRSGPGGQPGADAPPGLYPARSRKCRPSRSSISTIQRSEIEPDLLGEPGLDVGREGLPHQGLEAARRRSRRPRTGPGGAGP